jgi:hypothetical protein
MDGNYTALYSTLAASSATLTGLLFVAISIVPERLKKERSEVGIEIQASGCMFCFVNVLVIALFGLTGQSNVTMAALILGLIGILYALASLRSLQIVRKLYAINFAQFGFIATFMVLFIVQAYNALHIEIHNPKPANILSQFSTLPIVILVVGVVRTWQLIGLRNTGLISSLRIIVNAEKTVDSSKK